LRARAIENLAYVIAAGQHGTHPNGRTTFGHSMIVDPWGQVVAEQEPGDGVVVADIDLALMHRLREEFPVLLHRRL
jgi:nitrilase